MAYSIGTIVSDPFGIGAPVAIRTAWPRRTSASGRRPTRARPTIGKVTGSSTVAASISALLTANPSIAEDVNGGRSDAAVMSTASTQPYDSTSGSSNGSNGLTSARIDALTSSTERIG